MGYCNLRPEPMLSRWSSCLHNLAFKKSDLNNGESRNWRTLSTLRQEVHLRQSVPCSRPAILAFVLMQAVTHSSIVMPTASLYANDVSVGLSGSLLMRFSIRRWNRNNGETPRPASKFGPSLRKSRLKVLMNNNLGGVGGRGDKL